MNLFKPSRRISYLALLTIALAVLASVYRQSRGDSPVALALGVMAIFAGIVTISLFYVEWRGQFRSVLKGSGRYHRALRRGRVIAILGAILVIGSFAWLAAVVAFLSASPLHMLFFQIWLVIFLVGSGLLFSPTIVKWGIILGIVHPHEDDESPK